MSRWYIIHAYSGFENKVRESILSEARRLGLETLVEAVEVPTETITEVKRGKKVQTERSVGHCNRKPSRMRTKATYCGWRMRAYGPVIASLLLRCAWYSTFQALDSK